MENLPRDDSLGSPLRLLHPLLVGLCCLAWLAPADGVGWQKPTEIAVTQGGDYVHVDRRPLRYQQAFTYGKFGYATAILALLVLPGILLVRPMFVQIWLVCRAG
jgi:hypothetical protein